MHKKCHQCGLTTGKQYIRAEGFIFHPACAPKRFKKAAPSPTLTTQADPLFCSVCRGELTGKYLYNHWGETAHPQHQGQKTHPCSTCHRFLSATTQQGLQYGDGRIICGLCQITAVTESESVVPSRQRVLQALKTAGFGYIPDYISITLSDQRRLNQVLKKRDHANSHGLTKTIEKSVNGRVQHREHSIFILYGLPRIVFEGVLAHELLHVWLNEQVNTRERLPREIEGFCNLGTAYIYQQENTPLSHYLLERMHKDTDPVYGEGYRIQHQRLLQMGWDGLRDYMQRPAPFKKALKTVDRWLDRFNL